MKWIMGNRGLLIKYLTILISIAGAYYSLANYHQGVGYDKAVTEISRESADKIAAATGEAIHAAEIKIAQSLERSRLLFDAELKLAKEEQVVEIQIREVINDVEKIVYVGNCGKLNVDSIKLLNQTINHVNSASTN